MLEFGLGLLRFFVATAIGGVRDTSFRPEHAGVSFEILSLECSHHVVVPEELHFVLGGYGSVWQLLPHSPVA